MHTLTVVLKIAHRELLSWWRNKPAILGGLMFPFIFLLVFGSGLNDTMGSLIGDGWTESVGVDYKQFILPGAIAMNMLITSVFLGITLVQDRDAGILRGVLVSPVPRTTIAFGKALGSAVAATLQGTFAFVIAPIAGVALSFTLIGLAMPVMFVSALALSSMGVALAARSKHVENYQGGTQYIAFPMIFLSGMYFPVSNIPAWLSFVVRINPVSYAVDALRRVVMVAQGLPEDVMGQLATFGLAIDLFGHQLSVGENLLVIGAFGLVMIMLSGYLVSLPD